MAHHGIGVLRFDFTGLGNSKGNFSETNFETNIADIRAAVTWMAAEHQAPKILMGHSLGGAAMMASAPSIDSAVGIVTLAAPSCTKHLGDFLSRQNPAIEASGEGEVEIGGRTYVMRQQLLDSLRGRDLKTEIAKIKLHHLIFHSRQDETLDFRHAEEIFAMTRGAKSLITLDGSDHLLVNQRQDAEFVADQIALWSSRCLQ